MRRRSFATTEDVLRARTDPHAPPIAVRAKDRVRVTASATVETIPLEETLRYRNRGDPPLDLSTGTDIRPTT